MVSLPRPRRPSAVDVLLAGLLVAVVLAEAAAEPTVRHPALHAGVGGLVMVALAWRRVRPLPVATVVVTGDVLLAINGGDLSVVFGLLVMAFTVGAETDGVRSWLGLAVLLTPFLVGIALANDELVPGDLGAGLVIIGLPWLAGRALRERAVGLAEAMTRAERLEEEREHDARAAAVAERTRLARELHDVVAHSVSVIAIQVQAVRRRLGREHPREAADLAAVETAAREAMAEMRRLFGVLRDDGEEAALAPQPGLGELPRLLDRVRETGVEVALETAGEPVGLPPGLDLAAYRIVQEAVTNALRHSGATRLVVRLAWSAAELEVLVEDDGRGLAGAGTAGHGLRGIRERAALYGGSLDVGPAGGAGARVHARLPIGGGP